MSREGGRGEFSGTAGEGWAEYGAEADGSLCSSLGSGFFPQSLASALIDLGENCLGARAPSGKATEPLLLS